MAEFMPLDGDRIGHRLRAALGRVLKVSETTEIKGQFGLEQSSGTGKKLKTILFYRMSHLYKPLQISLKHKKLQWLNSIVHNHDMFCHCDKPFQHTILGILEQEPRLPFTPGEQETLRLCLSTGDRTAEDGAELGEGELDRLFEQDVFGEDAATDTG